MGEAITEQVTRNRPGLDLLLVDVPGTRDLTGSHLAHPLPCSLGRPEYLCEIQERSEVHAGTHARRDPPARGSRRETVAREHEDSRRIGLRGFLSLQ